LADFRGEPTNSFLVCPLMRTRRGVSLVLAYLTDEAENIRRSDGSKIKITTGAIKDTGAVVRLPGPVDGPILIAEGPETGLSLWAATGYETHIGVGNLSRMMPPSDRRLVICRDDDKPNSPADKALGRMLAAWRKQGISLAVATPWRTRRGDKSDFNDVIRSEGATAVRDRVELALVPGAPPPKRMPVDEARRVLDGAVAQFFDAAAQWHIDVEPAGLDAKTQAEARLWDRLPEEARARTRTRAEAKAAGAIARAARAIAKEAPAGEARKAAQAKARDAEVRAAQARQRAAEAADDARPLRKEIDRIKRKVVKEMVVATQALIPPAPVHAIRVDTGLGKSHAARRAVAALLQRTRSAGDVRTVAFAVPTHKLGNEQVALFNALPEAKGLHAAVWRGREANDTDGQAMCLDLPAVKDAQGAMMDVQTAVCRRVVDKVEVTCPHFAECLYQRQRAAKADLWFVPHELLFTAKPAAIGEPAVVVVDESVWQSGLIDPSNIALDAIEQDDKIPDDPIGGDRLRFLRHRFLDAIRNLPDGPITRDALNGRAFLPIATAPKNGTTIETRGPEQEPVWVYWSRQGQAWFRDDNPMQQAPEGATEWRPAEAEEFITPEHAGEAVVLEWRRYITPEIWPGMPAEARREAARAAAGNRTIRRLTRLWEALKALARHGGPAASGWAALATVDTPDGAVRAVRLKGRRDLGTGWAGLPTLALDATMDPVLLRPYWPRVELTADLRAEAPHQRVRQVVDRTYSKALLGQGNALRDVHAIICREARRHAPGRVLVVVQMAIETALPGVGPLPVNVELAHHNDVAGKDGWGAGPNRAGVVALIVVGRTAPSPAAVESQAEALTGEAIEPLLGWYAKADAAREMVDGTMEAAEADRHPHPIADAVRWQIAEGELVQIIGRARGINRTAADPVDVLIMVNAPLPLPVNETLAASDLDPGPDDLMLAAGGVVLANPTDAAAAYPALWANREAAKKAFERISSPERLGTKTRQLGTFPNKELLIRDCPQLAGKCPQPLSGSASLICQVEYQLAEARRSRSVARHDPALVPDLATWLTERLGPLAWCSSPPVPGPKPNVVEAMAARGLILNGASHAAAMYPDLFPSREAAKKAIARVLAGRRVLDMECAAGLTCRAHYQVAGAGNTPAEAIGTLKRFATLQVDLESTLGPLAAFEILPEIPGNLRGSWC
jgi:Toprim domain